MKKLIYLILFLFVWNLSYCQLKHKEILLGQEARIPSNVENHDIVTEIGINQKDTFMAVQVFSLVNFEIKENPDNIYGITYDTLYMADNTELTIGVDTVVIVAYYGQFYDIDTIFVNIIDISSNSTFCDLDAGSDGDGTRASPRDNYSFINGSGSTPNYNYWLKRGTSETVTIEINPDDSYMITSAYGRGKRPILYSALSGSQDAIIQHDGSTGNIEYWSIDFQKENGQSCLFKDDYGKHLVLQNCILEGVGADYPFNLLRTYRCDTVLLYYNIFRYSGDDNWYNRACENIVVWGCRFREPNYDIANGDCAQIWPETAQDRDDNFLFAYSTCIKKKHPNKHGFVIGDEAVGDTCYNVTVHDCSIYGTSENGSNMKGISIQECVNVKEYNNIVIGADRCYNFHGGSRNVLFYNNIGDSCYGTGIFLWSGMKNCSIMNSTIYNWGWQGETEDAGIAIFYSDIYLRNNIFYDADGDLLFYWIDEGSDEDYNIANDWTGISPGPNSIEGTSSFVSPINKNFKLNPNSLGTDEGTDVGIELDFEGKKRFRDWWMGAYEYNEDEYLMDKEHSKRNQVIIY